MTLSGKQTQEDHTMKNRILFFAISLLLGTAAMAQTGRIGTHDAISKWTPSTASPFANISEGRSIAQQIIDLVGLRPNFEVREANIPNAAAVTYGGKRFVLYNPNFIRQLEKTTGTQWAGISVMAHEIGHHLNGHTISASGSQPTLELEADEFSGFVLRKMGASLTDAQAAMKTLASINASKTHPGKYDRLTAIADGWNKADAQLTGKAVVKRPSTQPQEPVVNNSRNYPTNTRNTTVQPAISSRDIIGEVRFKADPNGSYYVTNRYNLVRVKNNQLSVIGKLTTLNSRQYPYLIYDESNTQLLVDARGNIVTKQGLAVGRLTARG